MTKRLHAITDYLTMTLDELRAERALVDMLTFEEIKDHFEYLEAATWYRIKEREMMERKAKMDALFAPVLAAAHTQRVIDATGTTPDYPPSAAAERPAPPTVDEASEPRKCELCGGKLTLGHFDVYYCDTCASRYIDGVRQPDKWDAADTGTGQPAADATAQRVLEERLTSGKPEDRVIERGELQDAARLVAEGKVQPIEGKDYYVMPETAQRVRLTGIPGIPVTPKVAKDVELKADQWEQLKVLAKHQEGLRCSSYTGAGCVHWRTAQVFVLKGLAYYGSIGHYQITITEFGKQALAALPF